MKKSIITTLVVFQILMLLMMIISINYPINRLGIAPLVSAENSVNCCTKTKEGAICQDVPASYTNCSQEAIPTKCESVSSCKQGCCIDEKEGLCTPNSPRQKCEDGEGIFKEDKNCNVAECKKGCCALGSNAQFITDKQCNVLSSMYGFEKDFRNLETEFECIALNANQSIGACLFENNLCKFLTESECGKFKGKFSKDNLCSKESLNTTCKKQVSVGCLEGKDEIYWFDSCGNKENIYSSNKDSSWNNGKVLEKEKSCSSDSSNADSEECGNCNYFLGSKCTETSLGKTSIKEGNFICENLNCIDENGKRRRNGESWCDYDSYIGDGKDTVGSRHWKKICTEGEIVSEPCADYRGQICTESKINETKNEFSIASCVINEAMACLNYNGDNIGKCLENKDCMIKNINVDSGFKFDTCVGKYPRGFDLTGERDDSSQNICALGNQKCTVLYQKDYKGKWKCIKNCNCLTKEFSQQMNDLCISLGDCGNYVNYIGKGTDNSRVTNAPSTSWAEYKQYSEPIKGQTAEPKSLGQILKYLNGIKSEGVNSTDNSANVATLIGTVSGGVGTLITAITFVTGKSLFYLQGYGWLGAYPTGHMTGTAATNIGSGIAGAAIGAAIGAMVGGYLAKWRGISGGAATVMTFAGATAGAAVGYAYTTGASLTSSTGILGLSALGWTAAIGAAVMAYIAIVGVGKTKTVEVGFECMPWEPPLGGEDCSKCNEDALKPCTEYRCSSLGKACKLLNEDSENPTCGAVANDNTPPKISTGVIQSNFTLNQEGEKKSRINETGKDCITEFTPVLFSMNTDEYSQCKYSFEKTNDYESMKEYPLEKNKFSINHTFVFSIPSIESLSVYDIQGDLRKRYGNTNMYIRCQDYYGNYNLEEYAINFCVNQMPDITAPKLMATNPKENSYLKYGATEIPFYIYLNEPAECSYDVIDRNYELMANKMTCYTELTEVTDFGWRCFSNLTNLKSNEENKFYIRCKDKPWLASDNETRKANTESFLFVLKNSKDELNITFISPKGEIKAGFEPVTVALETKTSGGISNGKANCYYKFLDNEVRIPFFETSSSYHKQIFDTMMKGSYNLLVECEDEAGNTANAETDFTLNIDTDAPKVTRVYNEGENLILTTNEEAECYYDLNRCNLDTKNSSSMTPAFSTKHSAKKITGQTYHIKCIDIWGNQNEGCTIKVKAID